MHAPIRRSPPRRRMDAPPDLATRRRGPRDVGRDRRERPHAPEVREGRGTGRELTPHPSIDSTDDLPSVLEPSSLSARWRSRARADRLDPLRPPKASRSMRPRMCSLHACKASLRFAQGNESAPPILPQLRIEAGTCRFVAATGGSRPTRTRSPAPTRRGGGRERRRPRRAGFGRAGGLRGHRRSTGRWPIPSRGRRGGW